MIDSKFRLSDHATLVLAVLLVVGAMIATAFSPITDLHAFRQTQTAISVWAMGAGGPLLAYETPVLGFPWQVPFEFPAFQWMTLLLWKLTGQPLEFVGRLVSVSALLASIWPIRKLAQRLSPDPMFASGVAAAILTAPVMLFWARTFMIETTALLFAVSWLGMLLDTMDRPSWWRCVAAVALGSLAAATKITTFAPFFGFGLLMVAWHTHRTGKGSISLWTMVIASFAAPLFAGLAWTDYADQIKSGVPLASRLTSEALQGWNLGSMADRKSVDFALLVLFKRPLAVLGPALFALPLLLPIALWRKPAASVLALLCIFTYAGCFLLFAKLYRIHDYYQVAAAPFLCAAVVMALWSVTGARHKTWFLAGVLTLQLSQLAYFGTKYIPIMAGNDWSNSLVRAGRFARSHTAPGDGILVVGTGWNSAIPFYAERRAVALSPPPWVTADQLEVLLSSPPTYFGSSPLTLAVRCDYMIGRFPKAQRAVLDAYFQSKEPIPGSRIGSCQSFYVK